jgi:hypothetical protein
MLITILAMIKLTAAQTQIRLLRLIPGWKYASRSGPYHVGQGWRGANHKKRIIMLAVLFWVSVRHQAELSIT